MNSTTETESRTPEEIAQYLADMGFSLHCVSTPAPYKPKDKDHWDAFAYSCTISRNKHSMQIPYRKGLAYVTIKKPRKWPRFERSWVYHDLLRQLIETPKDSAQSWESGMRVMMTRQPPTLDEVIYSVVMESTAYTDGMAWPEFATEYGYNEDSMKDHEIYQTCLKQSREFECLLASREEWDELRDLFTDY